jgi:hypothetical protein
MRGNAHTGHIAILWEEKWQRQHDGIGAMAFIGFHGHAAAGQDDFADWPGFASVRLQALNCLEPGNAKNRFRSVLIPT